MPWYLSSVCCDWGAVIAWLCEWTEGPSRSNGSITDLQNFFLFQLHLSLSSSEVMHGFYSRDCGGFFCYKLLCCVTLDFLRSSHQDEITYAKIPLEEIPVADKMRREKKDSESFQNSDPEWRRKRGEFGWKHTRLLCMLKQRFVKATWVSLS